MYQIFSKKPYFTYRAYEKSRKTNQSEISLRFKIRIKLSKSDFTRLTDFLSENSSAKIELFPGENFEFIAVSPLSVVVEGFGYSIRCEVFFQARMGLEVYDNLNIDNETCRNLSVNFRNIKLSKIVSEANELESDLKEFLNILERIVNQTCNMFDKLVEKTFTIDSECLDKQLDMVIRAKELEKRSEVARPFGSIHAKGRRDAGERAGDDLVPVYMERDKAYLFEDNKMFILLPRNFVMKLLRMNSSTLVPADQFTEKENEVLRKFSMRKYIKTMKVAGKTFYYDLNEKTRKLLLKGLKKL